MDVKDLTMKLNVCIALILSAYSLAIAQSETFQAVESEKIPGILRTISNQTKANFEQIHTWQGELESSRHFIHKGKNAKETFETLTDAVGPCPNEVAEVDSCTIIFKCDLDKGLFHSKSSREKPTLYFDPADNKDLGTKSLPKCSSQIVTNEYRYSAEPSARKNGEVIQRKAVKEKADIDGPSYKGLQPVYLPSYIFDIDSQVWERYPDFANIIEEKGEYVVGGLALKVEQRTLSGDVQYRVHEPFNINAFNINNCWIINTFSANSGYNIISSERIRADGKLMTKKSFEYQKVNGVYVPIRDTEDTYDYSRDFSLRSHEEDVFKNVRINDSIPAETFTYKNLGLKDGDEFIDRIASKEYKYQDANLVLIADLPAPASGKQEPAAAEPNE
jgi:hypothetical protein